MPLEDIIDLLLYWFAQHTHQETLNLIKTVYSILLIAAKIDTKKEKKNKEAKLTRNAPFNPKRKI